MLGLIAGCGGDAEDEAGTRRMLVVTVSSPSSVAETIRRLQPGDDVGRNHRDEALAWLASTDDVYRRVKPRTPSPHLVSYFLLIDRAAGRVLLCDHRLSGLWLPTGGHVEPGEDPAETVRREAGEELGITAVFDGACGEDPFFLTVTETTGPPSDRHTDVTLWFALTGDVDQHLEPDAREFHTVRWWAPVELHEADAALFEPHLLRALDALGFAH